MRSETKVVSYRSMVWQQFRKNKPALTALYVLAFMLLIALLAPLLANNRPLYVQYQDKFFFPAVSFSKVIVVKTDSGMETINPDAGDWKKIRWDEMILPPVVYAPGASDFFNLYFVKPGGEQKFEEGGKIVPMPWRFRHWLGTGSHGDDLLSGLINGTRISLTIGIISMLIASLIGIFIGVLAGFFGDDRLMISRGKFMMILIGIFFAWFYAFQLRSNLLKEAWQNKSEEVFFYNLLISILLFTGIIFLFFIAGNFLQRISFLSRKLIIPVDTILSRLIEIFVSLPLLLLIITLAAISKPSISNVIIIIGLTQWTNIARLTRAEMLRIRQLEYIQSARALGYSNLRVMMKHALPNAITPALVSISFIIGNAILIESSLSFIGIGVPPTITSWGSLIAEGRENFNAWWMVLFPGLAILITVLSCNLIGEGWRDALDPKLRKQ